ncbi:MAG: NUDIX domain-containing protein [Chloroflexales bacterium]
MIADQTHGGSAPILAVGGVIYRIEEQNTPEILIIKKRNGFWTLPKGRIEPGESEEDALHREIAEETGLSGMIEATGASFTYPIMKGGVEYTKQVRYYLVRALSMDLYLSNAEKIEHARWCILPAAMRRIHSPRLHMVVLWAANQLGVVIADGIPPTVDG